MRPEIPTLIDNHDGIKRNMYVELARLSRHYTNGKGSCKPPASEDETVKKRLEQLAKDCTPVVNYRLQASSRYASMLADHLMVVVNRERYTAKEVLDDAIKKWEIAATGTKREYRQFKDWLSKKYGRGCSFCGVFKCDCCVTNCEHGSNYERYCSELNKHPFTSKIARAAANKMLEEVKKITVAQVQEKLNEPLPIPRQTGK